MTEQQLKKGLFRLWIVVSVCWISYVGFDLYDEYLRMQNAFHEYHVLEYASAQSPEVVRSNFERTFLSHLTGMFVAPIGLLLLFLLSLSVVSSGKWR